jgi:hypothetical protein
MRNQICNAEKRLDNNANIRLRELVSVLVLGSEACLTEPRVSALNLPYAAALLQTAQDLCVHMKTLPTASFIPDPEASN